MCLSCGGGGSGLGHFFNCCVSEPSPTLSISPSHRFTDSALATSRWDGLVTRHKVNRASAHQMCHPALRPPRLITLEYLDVSCQTQSSDKTSSWPLPASSLLISCLCNFIHTHNGHCCTLCSDVAGPAGWSGYSCPAAQRANCQTIC